MANDKQSKDDLAQYYYDLGNYLYENEKFPEAINSFTKALETSPGRVEEICTNRAVAYLSSGDFDAAIDDLNLVIELNPTADDYCNRGLARYMKGEFAEAIEDYTTALELDPDFAMAIYYRGMTNSCLEGNEKAVIADANRYLELVPDDPRVLAMRGASYADMEDYDAAIRDLTASLELEPHPDTYHERGKAYHAKGDLQAAIADQTESINLRPTAEAYLHRGLAYAESGDLQAGTLDYAKLMKLDPGHPLVEYTRNLVGDNSMEDIDALLNDDNLDFDLLFGDDDEED